MHTQHTNLQIWLKLKFRLLQNQYRSVTVPARATADDLRRRPLLRPNLRLRCLLLPNHQTGHPTTLRPSCPSLRHLQPISPLRPDPPSPQSFHARSSCPPPPVLSCDLRTPCRLAQRLLCRSHS